jgi:hypothetical protein
MERRPYGRHRLKLGFGKNSTVREMVRKNPKKSEFWFGKKRCAKKVGKLEKKRTLPGFQLRRW